MPIETIISEVSPTPLRRNGRQTPVSHDVATERAGDDGDRGGDEQVQPDALVHPPRDDGAERDELAVGEVGQPGGAVDQRQPDGGDGDDQPELDAVGDRLREDVPASLGLAAVLAEEVVEDLALRRADVDDLLLLGLVAQRRRRRAASPVSRRTV